MTQATDALVLTGPAFQQNLIGSLLVTPTGGTQKPLADLLTGGSITPAGPTGAIQYNNLGSIGGYAVDGTQPIGIYNTIHSPIDISRAPYNAKCDAVLAGSTWTGTDDTAAWTAAIAQLTTQGGGMILVPPGYSLCQAGVIKIPSFSRLSGMGPGSGIIHTGTINTTVPLIDISGPSAGNHVTNVTIDNLYIDGNAAGGGYHLIRSFYASYVILQNLVINGAYGAIRAAELWDSLFFRIKGFYPGSNAPAIWIQNSAASVGVFGHSVDSSNQIRIIDTHLEDFFFPALIIEQGPGNSSPPNGIYVLDFKAETHVPITGSAMVTLGVGSTGNVFQNMYISMDVAPVGGSADLFANLGAGNNLISGLLLDSATGPIVNHPYYHNATNANGSDTIMHVGYTNNSLTGTPVSNAVVTIAPGAAQPEILGAINSLPVIPTTAGFRVAAGVWPNPIVTTNYTGQITAISKGSLVYPVSLIPGVNPGGIPVYIAQTAGTVTAISCRLETASGVAATVQPVKAANGTALSAGVPLTTNTFNANGTAATNQTLTLTSTSANLVLAPGDSIGFTTTGTFTASAAVIQIAISA